MTKGIKITRSGEKVSIIQDSLPDRKKPCLCVVRGNRETKYATFNNQDSANEFMQLLADLLVYESLDIRGATP